jgi:hypothetical protein
MVLFAVAPLLLSSLTGCGTFFTLTGLSLMDDSKLRPASVMGGTQYDTYLVKYGPQSERARAFADVLPSILFDIGLLPLTVPLAALFGDGPFDPEWTLTPIEKPSSGKEKTP